MECQTLELLLTRPDPRLASTEELLDHVAQVVAAFGAA
jgi:hypothetical protein